MLHFMNLAKRLGTAVFVIAMSVGLVNLPSTASAAPASPPAAAASALPEPTVQRAVVDETACASATESLARARQAVKKAKRVVAAKRKALKRAKRQHLSKARITKAKKRLKKAKRSLRAKQARVERLKASKAKNCAPVESGLSADQLGQLLALLSGAAGGGAQVPLDVEQFTALMDGVVPGGAGALDPATLMELLAGFNSGALDPSSIDPAALTALLGGLSPDQVTDLLAGAPLDPAVAMTMFQTFVDMFGELAGGSFELPDGFDPGVLLEVLSGLLGGLLGGGDLPELPLPCLPLPLPLPLPCG